MSFNSLGSLVTRKIRQGGYERQIQASMILEKTNTLLNEWFGQQTTDLDARAVSYKQRTVYIAITNMALKQQLMFSQQKFVEALNQSCSTNTIEAIRFHT